MLTMKKETVFYKPTYKYDGEIKQHPIERLDFEYVPENDIERLGINIRKAGKKIKDAFSGMGRC